VSGPYGDFGVTGGPGGVAGSSRGMQAMLHETMRGSGLAGVLKSLDWQSTTPPRLTGLHGLMKWTRTGLVV
jgi:hypothetical protein